MKRSIYLLIAGFVLSQSAAYAEVIQGMIINVDPASDMISVRQAVPSKHTPQQLEIKVKNDTKTKNVASLKELRVGQEVRVDAKENKQTNLFEAKSIEVTAAGNAENSAATPSASPEGAPKNSY